MDTFRFAYEVNGIVIESPLPFSELRAASGSGVDARLRVSFDQDANFPEHHDDENVYAEHFSQEGVTLANELHGRMTISRDEIKVVVRDLNHWERAKIYVLGTGLAILTLLRGAVTFHVSGIERNGIAYLFTGESCAGKSTFATCLVQSGVGDLISDDMARIDITGGCAAVWPGLRRVRLRSDVMARFGMSGDRGELWLSASERAGPIEVSDLFVLRPGDDDFSVVRAPTLDAIGLILESVFRGEFAFHLLGKPRLFRLATELVQNIRVHVVKYRHGVSYLEKNVDDLRIFILSLIGEGNGESK